MWVRSLGQEDALEVDMATHSSILAWRILWTEKPSGLPSVGSRRVGHDWAIEQQQEYLEYLVIKFQFKGRGPPSKDSKV